MHLFCKPYKNQQKLFLKISRLFYYFRISTNCSSLASIFEYIIIGGYQLNDNPPPKIKSEKRMQIFKLYIINYPTSAEKLFI